MGTRFVFGIEFLLDSENRWKILYRLEGILALSSPDVVEIIPIVLVVCNQDMTDVYHGDVREEMYPNGTAMSSWGPLQEAEFKHLLLGSSVSFLDGKIMERQVFDKSLNSNGASYRYGGSLDYCKDKSCNVFDEMSTRNGWLLSGLEGFAAGDASLFSRGSELLRGVVITTPWDDLESVLVVRQVPYDVSMDCGSLELRTDSVSTRSSGWFSHLTIHSRQTMVMFVYLRRKTMVMSVTMREVCYLLGFYQGGGAHTAFEGTEDNEHHTVLARSVCDTNAQECVATPKFEGKDGGNVSKEHQVFVVSPMCTVRDKLCLVEQQGMVNYLKGSNFLGRSIEDLKVFGSIIADSDCRKSSYGNKICVMAVVRTCGRWSFSDENRLRFYSTIVDSKVLDYLGLVRLVLMRSPCLGSLSYTCRPVLRVGYADGNRPKFFGSCCEVKRLIGMNDNLVGEEVTITLVLVSAAANLEKVGIILALVMMHNACDEVRMAKNCLLKLGYTITLNDSKETMVFCRILGLRGSASWDARRVVVSNKIMSCRLVDFESPILLDLELSLFLLTRCGGAPLSRIRIFKIQIVVGDYQESVEWSMQKNWSGGTFTHGHVPRELAHQVGILGGGLTCFMLQGVKCLSVQTFCELNHVFGSSF